MDSLKKVCMVIAIQGFQVKKFFYPREVGVVTCDGTFKYLKYKMPYTREELTPLDVKMVDFMKDFVNGLEFQCESDDSRDLSHLNDDIRQLYLSARRKDMYKVAYDGIAEKEILKELRIPGVSLTRYGCPGMYALEEYGYTAPNGCGRHEERPPMRRKFCTVKECSLYWQWLQDKIRQPEDDKNSRDVQRKMLAALW